MDRLVCKFFVYFFLANLLVAFCDAENIYEDIANKLPENPSLNNLFHVLRTESESTKNLNCNHFWEDVYNFSFENSRLHNIENEISIIFILELIYVCEQIRKDNKLNQNWPLFKLRKSEFDYFVRQTGFPGKTDPLHLLIDKEPTPLVSKHDLGYWFAAVLKDNDVYKIIERSSNPNFGSLDGISYDLDSDSLPFYFPNNQHGVNRTFHLNETNSLIIAAKAIFLKSEVVDKRKQSILNIVAADSMRFINGAELASLKLYLKTDLKYVNIDDANSLNPNEADYEKKIIDLLLREQEYSELIKRAESKSLGNTSEGYLKSIDYDTIRWKYIIALYAVRDCDKLTAYLPSFLKSVNGAYPYYYYFIRVIYESNEIINVLPNGCVVDITNLPGYDNNEILAELNSSKRKVEFDQFFWQFLRYDFRHADLIEFLLIKTLFQIELDTAEAMCQKKIGGALSARKNLILLKSILYDLATRISFTKQKDGSWKSKGTNYDFLHNEISDGVLTNPGELVVGHENPYGQILPEEDINLVILTLGKKAVENYSDNYFPSIWTDFKNNPRKGTITIEEWLKTSETRSSYYPLVKRLYAEWFSMAFSTLETDVTSIYINYEYYPAPVENGKIEINQAEVVRKKIEDKELVKILDLFILTRRFLETAFPIDHESTDRRCNSDYELITRLLQRSFGKSMKMKNWETQHFWQNNNFWNQDDCKSIRKFVNTSLQLDFSWVNTQRKVNIKDTEFGKVDYGKGLFIDSSTKHNCGISSSNDQRVFYCSRFVSRNLDVATNVFKKAHKYVSQCFTEEWVSGEDNCRERLLDGTFTNSCRSTFHYGPRKIFFFVGHEDHFFYAGLQTEINKKLRGHYEKYNSNKLRFSPTEKPWLHYEYEFLNELETNRKVQKLKYVKNIRDNSICEFQHDLNTQELIGFTYNDDWQIKIIDYSNFHISLTWADGRMNSMKKKSDSNSVYEIMIDKEWHSLDFNKKTEDRSEKDKIAKNIVDDLLGKMKACEYLM